MQSAKLGSNFVGRKVAIYNLPKLHNQETSLSREDDCNSEFMSRTEDDFNLGNYELCMNYEYTN